MSPTLAILQVKGVLTAEEAAKLELLFNSIVIPTKYEHLLAKVKSVLE
jgi:hypothetical protein